MSTAPPTPPTTPAGGPPTPAQTAAPEAVTLESVVDALRPMFGSQAPNIDTWSTRLLVERLLNEKKSRGPLQGADITAESLFRKAVAGWDDPSIQSGALLRTACVILGINPVPAATQPPAQDSTTPTRGDFPATLPGAAETTHATTDTDKAARRAAMRVRKTLKRARQRALLAGIASVVTAVAAVIAAVTTGWAAFGAAIAAVGAGTAGAFTGVKAYNGGRRRPRR